MFTYIYYVVPRVIQAVSGRKIIIKDDVEEIYEKEVTPYGNGAKIDSQKKYIGRKAFVIIVNSSTSERYV